MDEFPLDSVMGMTIRDMQLFFDVNYPGHRVFTFGVMGSDIVHIKIVGPIFNKTIKGNF